jgi:hypothetical protein
MILHVLVLKSVVAFLVFTRLLNGSIANNDDVVSVASLHLSLIGGFVATTEDMILRKNAIVMNAWRFRLDDDGNRENIIVFVLEYHTFRIYNVLCEIA